MEKPKRYSVSAFQACQKLCFEDKYQPDKGNILWGKSGTILTPKSLSSADSYNTERSSIVPSCSRLCDREFAQNTAIL